MDKYIGIKQVKAEPMTRGAYNLARGVKFPKDNASFNDEGYRIWYPDGYVSWSPKRQFEEAYSKIGENPLFETALLMRSPDYKDRFRAEYQQLSIRREKLGRMIEKYDSGTLGFIPACPMELLRDQHYMMGYYLEMLEERADHEGITLCGPKCMSFAEAMKCIKQGGRVYRKGWKTGTYLEAQNICGGNVVCQCVNNKPTGPWVAQEADVRADDWLCEVYVFPADQGALAPGA